MPGNNRIGKDQQDVPQQHIRRPEEKVVEMPDEKVISGNENTGFSIDRKELSLPGEADKSGWDM